MSDLITENSQRRSITRKRFLQGAAVAGGLGAVGFALPKSLIPPTYGVATDVDVASYIVDNESGTIKAYNGSTGAVDYSSPPLTDAAAVINSAIGALTAGGRIHVRAGTYNITTGISINAQNIELTGEVSRASVGNGTLFQYAGSGAAIHVQKTGSVLYRPVLRNFEVDYTGSSSNLGLAGVQLKAVRYALLDNLSVIGFSTSGSVGMQIAGSADGFSSTNTISNPFISSCETGLYTAKFGGNNATHTLVFGGAIGGGTNSKYGVFFDLGGESNVIVGTDIGYTNLSPAYGVWVEQDDCVFLGTRHESNTTDFVISSGTNRTQIIAPRFINGYKVSDSGNGTIIHWDGVQTARKSSVAPTTTDIPAGMFAAWKNTGDGSVRIYYNDGGTLKSVTLA